MQAQRTSQAAPPDSFPPQKIPPLFTLSQAKNLRGTLLSLTHCFLPLTINKGYWFYFQNTLRNVRAYPHISPFLLTSSSKPPLFLITMSESPPVTWLPFLVPEIHSHWRIQGVVCLFVYLFWLRCLSDHVIPLLKPTYGPWNKIEILSPEIIMPYMIQLSVSSPTSRCHSPCSSAPWIGPSLSHLRASTPALLSVWNSLSSWSDHPIKSSHPVSHERMSHPVVNLSSYSFIYCLSPLTRS